MPNSIWGTNPVFMLENGNYYFYHNDHLGTPQKMTDISGNTVWSAKYTSFGEAIVDSTSTIVNNLRFPGQYFDEETGKHYNFNRYYDPEAGRYISTDPIGFAGNDANLYRYVWNQPNSGIDPLGLLKFEEISDIVSKNNLSGQSNEIVICIAQKESSFNPNAGPDLAGKGLMGVTRTANKEITRLNRLKMIKQDPSLGKKLKKLSKSQQEKVGEKYDYDTGVFDPATNIKMGSEYLGILVDRFGDLKGALKHYGPEGYPVNALLECEKCLKKVNSCKKECPQDTKKKCGNPMDCFPKKWPKE